MYRNHIIRQQDALTLSVDAIRNRHLKILIVDDEYRFREALSSNLSEKYEAVVTDVDSGGDAVERLKRGEAFDLIFLDLRMANMSGTDTYVELKKIDANCSIVMMSSWSESDAWVNAEKLAGQLLSKAVMVQVLTKILSRVPRRK